MSFGAGAARLAGLSAVLLGWRPETFWHATPDELAATLAALTPSTQPPARAVLDALQERFPDGGRD